MTTTGNVEWDDSLERYIFCYYKHLLSKHEWAGWNYFMLKGKAAFTRSRPDQFPEDRWRNMSSRIEEGLMKDTTEALEIASEDPAIGKLIKEYPDDFYVSVALRILRDHSDEVVLVLCSRCLNLCGTPKAKLCLRCGHSWHSEEEAPG